MHLEEMIASVIQREVRRGLEEIKQAVAVEKSGPADGAFLSKKQAAKFAGVSTDTLDEWIRLGALRRYGRGRLVRIRRSELEAAMNAPVQSRPEESPEEFARQLMARRRG